MARRVFEELTERTLDDYETHTGVCLRGLRADGVDHRTLKKGQESLFYTALPSTYAITVRAPLAQSSAKYNEWTDRHIPWMRRLDISKNIMNHTCREKMWLFHYNQLSPWKANEVFTNNLIWTHTSYAWHYEPASGFTSFTHLCIIEAPQHVPFTIEMSHFMKSGQKGLFYHKEPPQTLFDPNRHPHYNLRKRKAVDVPRVESWEELRDAIEADRSLGDHNELPEHVAATLSAKVPSSQEATKQLLDGNVCDDVARELLKFVSSIPTYFAWAVPPVDRVQAWMRRTKIAQSHRGVDALPCRFVIRATTLGVIVCVPDMGAQTSAPCFYVLPTIEDTEEPAGPSDFDHPRLCILQLRDDTLVIPGRIRLQPEWIRIQDTGEVFRRAPNHDLTVILPPARFEVVKRAHPPQALVHMGVRTVTLLRLIETFGTVDAPTSDDKAVVLWQAIGERNKALKDLARRDRGSSDPTAGANVVQQ